MKGTVLAGYTIVVRTEANQDSNLRLKPGDIVYGVVNNSSGRNKIYFNKIYRSLGTIDATPGLCNAAVDNDSDPLVVWIYQVDEPEPGTDPNPTPTTKQYTEFRRETYPDGSVWEGSATFIMTKVV